MMTDANGDTAQLDPIKVGEWDRDERIDVPGKPYRTYFIPQLNWESPSFSPDPLISLYPEHRAMWESVTAVAYLPELGFFDGAKALYPPLPNLAPPSPAAATTSTSASVPAPPASSSSSDAAASSAGGSGSSKRPRIDEMDIEEAEESAQQGDRNEMSSGFGRDVVEMIQGQFAQMKAVLEPALSSLSSLAAPQPSSTSAVTAAPKRNRIVVRVDDVSCSLHQVYVR